MEKKDLLATCRKDSSSIGVPVWFECECKKNLMLRGKGRRKMTTAKQEAENVLSAKSFDERGSAWRRYRHYHPGIVSGLYRSAIHPSSKHSKSTLTKKIT
jgi:hypothetical protein